MNSLRRGLSTMPSYAWIHMFSYVMGEYIVVILLETTLTYNVV